MNKFEVSPANLLIINNKIIFNIKNIINIKIRFFIVI